MSSSCSIDRDSCAAVLEDIEFAVSTVNRLRLLERADVLAIRSIELRLSPSHKARRAIALPLPETSVATAIEEPHIIIQCALGYSIAIPIALFFGDPAVLASALLNPDQNCRFVSSQPLAPSTLVSIGERMHALATTADHSRVSTGDAPISAFRCIERFLRCMGPPQPTALRGMSASDAELETLRAELNDIGLAYVEIMISVISAAVCSSRRTSVGLLWPFSDAFLLGSSTNTETAILRQALHHAYTIGGQSQLLDFDRIESALDGMPLLSSAATHPLCLSLDAWRSLPMTTLQLIQHVLASPCRFRESACPASIATTAVANGSFMEPPHMFLVAELPADPVFSRLRRRHGLVTAYHGSAVSNWYSIARKGLTPMSRTAGQTNGALFGDGIYLSSDMRLAREFSSLSAAHASCGRGRQVEIVGVYDVALAPDLVRHAHKEMNTDGSANADSNETPDRYVIANDNSCLRLRGLCIWFDCPQEAIAASQVRKRTVASLPVCVPDVADSVPRPILKSATARCARLLLCHSKWAVVALLIGIALLWLAARECSFADRRSWCARSKSLRVLARSAGMLP
jgi:hypothetical protein